MQIRFETYSALSDNNYVIKHGLPMIGSTSVFWYSY